MLHKCLVYIATQGEAAASLLVHQSLIKILSLQGHVAHLILCNPGEEIRMRGGGGKAKISSLCCNQEYIHQQQGTYFDLKGACHFFFRDNGFPPVLCRGVCMLEV